MASMRFMSTLEGRPPKFIRFDSSPGRAIGQALDAGCWDESSYRSVLMEDRGEEKTYDVFMKRAESEISPGPHPSVKVGILTWMIPEDTRR